jgi:hypothetical protein
MALIILYIMRNEEDIRSTSMVVIIISAAQLHAASYLRKLRSVYLIY